MTDLQTSSVDDLVKQVVDLRRSLGSDSVLWYRGLGCREHHLLPRLLRDAPDIEAALERERRLITRFRQRSLPYWPQGYPQNDWEHMFAMQHHGVATRLLDWSESLFVALYFALEIRTGSQHDHQGNGESGPCVPVIWCLDAVNWNRNVPALAESGEDIGVLTTADKDLIQGYEPESPGTRLVNRKATPIAMFGTHNSPRIVAQRGTFTVAGCKDLRPLEEYAASVDPGILWRISLDGDTSQMKEDLSALGITESMIFPDLPGLAREIDASERW